jgi:hypothetical protein
MRSHQQPLGLALFKAKSFRVAGTKYRTDGVNPSIRATRNLLLPPLNVLTPLFFVRLLHINNEDMAAAGCVYNSHTDCDCHPLVGKEKKLGAIQHMPACGIEDLKKVCTGGTRGVILVCETYNVQILRTMCVWRWRRIGCCCFFRHYIYMLLRADATC